MCRPLHIFEAGGNKIKQQQHEFYSPRGRSESVKINKINFQGVAFDIKNWEFKALRGGKLAP